MTTRILLAATLGLGLLFSQAGAAATPAAFTATYNVLQGGTPLGTAIVTLRDAGNGEWIYAKDVKGTGGLAALLGANLQESSRFRWKNNLPELISYDYRMVTMGKTKRRDVTTDWNRRTVTVDEGKGSQTYPAADGMVERNTTSLALGIALRSGQQQITLPVAVRQTVETQQFKVTGKQQVQVAAGNFNADHVERSDTAREFSAWYVPSRYPVPVKLSQRDGGDLTMELVSYREP